MRWRGCGQADAVDYVGVAALKWRALRTAFAAFKANAKPAPPAGFRQIPRRARRAAVALCLLRGAAAQIRQAVVGMAGGVAAAGRCQMRRAAQRARTRREIEFVEFVQWTADRQLGALPRIWRSSSA